MMRKSDGSRIEYVRVAKADRERGELNEVRWEDIGRGFEIPGGNVLLTDAELAEVKGDERHCGEIVTFAKASDIPAQAIDKSYHVKPGDGGDRGYALLHAALKRAGKVGVLRFAMRDSVHLAILSPDDEGYLVLSQLHWGNDMTRPDFEAPSATFSDKDNSLADQLIETLSDDEFDFSQHKDESAERLENIVMAKIANGPTHVTADEAISADKDATSFTDMMTAIQQTIDASKADKPKSRRKSVA
jgi:DNA end-binding protein Ku